VSGAAKPGRRPRPSGRPRTGARVAAVQALFQSEQTGESAEAIIDQFVRHRIGVLPGQGGFEEGRVPEAHVPLFAGVVRAAAANGEKVDVLVRGHLARDWPMERLDPVLRALLRAAAAELLNPAEPPARVVINEYLDIARGFMDEQGVRFANGVLDAMAHAQRPGEFAERPAG
jgi:N utilization substance protein B